MAQIQKALNVTLDEEVEFHEDMHQMEAETLDSLNGICYLFVLEEQTVVKFSGSEVASGRLWKVGLIAYINDKLEK